MPVDANGIYLKHVVPKPVVTLSVQGLHSSVLLGSQGGWAGGWLGGRAGGWVGGWVLGCWLVGSGAPPCPCRRVIRGQGVVSQGFRPLGAHVLAPAHAGFINCAEAPTGCGAHALRNARHSHPCRCRRRRLLRRPRRRSASPRTAWPTAAPGRRRWCPSRWPRPWSRRPRQRANQEGGSTMRGPQRGQRRPRQRPRQQQRRALPCRS